MISNQGSLHAYVSYLAAIPFMKGTKGIILLWAKAKGDQFYLANKRAHTLYLTCI